MPPRTLYDLLRREKLQPMFRGRGYSGSGGGGTPEPDQGLILLTESAKSRLYYDLFSQLTEADGQQATGPYTNLGPLIAPLITDNPVDPPTVDEVQINEAFYKAALSNASPTGFLIDHNGVGVYDSSFDWFLYLMAADGDPVSQYRVHGGFDIAGAGGTGWQCFVTTDQRLQFAWRVSTNATSIAFRTPSIPTLLQDRNTGPLLINVSMDFEGDTVKIWVNGIAQTVESVSGNIADYDPSDWSGSPDLGLGCYNVNGTITSPGINLWTMKHAVLAKLTDQERAFVTNTMML